MRFDVCARKVKMYLDDNLLGIWLFKADRSRKATPERLIRNQKKKIVEEKVNNFCETESFIGKGDCVN